MIYISKHQDVLNELDTRLFIINNTHLAIMDAVNHQCFSVTILTDICSCVTCLSTGLISLKENTDVLYEYLRMLASHLGNLLIVSLHDLRKSLGKGKA